jgi:hypothetical protein
VIANTFAELRTQVQSKMDTIGAHVGATMTTDELNQLCFTIALLHEPNIVARIRLGDTAEQMLKREHYLPCVAETFAEEVERHEQLTEATIREFVQNTGPGGFTEAELVRYLMLAERVFRYGDGK